MALKIPPQVEFKQPRLHSDIVESTPFVPYHQARGYVTNLRMSGSMDVGRIPTNGRFRVGIRSDQPTTYDSWFDYNLDFNLE